MGVPSAIVSWALILDLASAVPLGRVDIASCRYLLGRLTSWYFFATRRGIGGEELCGAMTALSCSKGRLCLSILA